MMLWFRKAILNVTLALIQAEATNERTANEHIEPIADIVMNEPCENVIVTSSSSSHIEEALQFGNRSNDNT